MTAATLRQLQLKDQLPLKSRYLGPDSAGILMTSRQFDEAEFKEGWRYELINGVLVVSPTPLEQERDPNEELGYMLRDYQRKDPRGKCIDKTLAEQTVHVRRKRRRADRVIWIGLGRLPRRGEAPTVIAEFVSKGKRDWLRDYVHKRDEYMAIGVLEYWIFDRFRRTLTVFTRQGRRVRKAVFAEDRVYTTPLLPGFELPLKELLALADEWEDLDE